MGVGAQRVHPVALTAGLLAGSFSAASEATEGGGSNKIPGADTVLAGVMPDPGLHLTAFAGRYEADRTLNGAGNPRPGISNFDVRVHAVTARLQYVWPDAKLWGANIETRVAFALYGEPRISFDLSTPAGGVHRSDTAHGLSDLLFDPILLGWHHDDFHQSVGVEFYLSTAPFDPLRVANLGRGYHSIAPSYRFTWFATPALELSGTLVYLYNLENPDTRYKSGREAVLDYGVGYTVAAGWQLGASGYLYRQVSDDHQNGAVVNDGNRGQVRAIGPFVRHRLSPDWGFTFKWQVESGARNKTEGQRFFLQMARRLY